MLQKIKLQCGYCFQPTSRRLANFKVKDEFECYSESYVKRFWGLCDSQKSQTNCASKSSDKQVVTRQPHRQLLI